MLCKTSNISHNIPCTQSNIWRIFHEILLVPQNTVMDLYNVMIGWKARELVWNLQETGFVHLWSHLTKGVISFPHLDVKIGLTVWYLLWVEVKACNENNTVLNLCLILNALYNTLSILWWILPRRNIKWLHIHPIHNSSMKERYTFVLKACRPKFMHSIIITHLVTLHNVLWNLLNKTPFEGAKLGRNYLYSCDTIFLSWAITP